MVPVVSNGVSTGVLSCTCDCRTHKKSSRQVLTSSGVSQIPCLAALLSEPWLEPVFHPSFRRLQSALTQSVLLSTVQHSSASSKSTRLAVAAAKNAVVQHVMEQSSKVQQVPAM